MPNVPGDLIADSEMPSFATVLAPEPSVDDRDTGVDQARGVDSEPAPLGEEKSVAPAAGEKLETEVARNVIARAPQPPPPVQTPPDDDQERPSIQLFPEDWHERRPIPFLEQQWAQNLISFGTSLALHVVVIVLGLVTYKAAVQFVEKEQEQIVVPSSDMASDGIPGGALHPGLGDDPNRDAGQDAIKDTPGTHGAWADRPGDTLADVLTGGGSGNDAAATFIATGLTGGSGGLLSGAGSGDTSGIGGSGQIAPWGPPGGGSGLGPKTNFLGSGGNANSVIYICDASGSMDTKFDLLKRKLEESIDRLQPIQQFNVVFFNDDKVFPLSSNFLLQAQTANKSKAYHFIDEMYVHAGSDPINAITAAFTMRPQLIYFLTDGEFPNDEAILKRIATLNSRHATRINTILLMGKRSEETGMATFVKVMKRIASENGGNFSSLSVEDF